MQTSVGEYVIMIGTVPIDSNRGRGLCEIELGTEPNPNTVLWRAQIRFGEFLFILKNHLLL